MVAGLVAEVPPWAVAMVAPSEPSMASAGAMAVAVGSAVEAGFAVRVGTPQRTDHHHLH